MGTHCSDGKVRMVKKIQDATGGPALSKISNFPPHCIFVLAQLPLSFSTGGSHHLTEPLHKDTVLLCRGCLRPLRLYRGHQRFLAKAGNSKFYKARCVNSLIKSSEASPHMA